MKQTTILLQFGVRPFFLQSPFRPERLIYSQYYVTSCNGLSLVLKGLPRLCTDRCLPCGCISLPSRPPLSPRRLNRFKPGVVSVLSPLCLSFPPAMSLTKRLSTLDVSLSLPLHLAPGGGALEALLLLPAVAFQPPVVVAWLCLLLLAVPRRGWAEVAGGVLATLATTTVLKSVVGRPRPAPTPHPPRWLNLRAREKNASLPSGDAAQAACLAYLLLAGGLLPPGWVGVGAALVCVVLVAAARVYYRAHWVLDTVAGAVVGCAVGVGWRRVAQLLW